MGSVTDMIDVFINAFTGFIDAGSAAGEGFLGAGSTAADGVYDVIKGGLGSITE